MRIHLGLVRNRFLLLLALTLAAFAREAGAQPLTPVVGRPIPYRISMPEGWGVAWAENTLTVDDPDEDIVIVFTAMDLAAAGTRPASMSEAEARRVLTERAMSSDSVLLALLQRNATRLARHPLSDITREIGTLGRERAGWISARTRIEGEPGWLRVGLTVDDGILYLLLFMGRGEPRPEVEEPLIDGIADSFLSAETPGA